MRLITYNIHKGFGGTDRRYRFERILEVVRAEEPDLVCLQEVDQNARRSCFDNQPEILHLHLHPLAGPYQLNHPHGNGGYGNLLLSRWPLAVEHSISLRQDTRKNRGAQLVVVATPEGPLHLVHVHLGLAERERRWQVNHLLQHDAFRTSAHLPTLVVGDFNDWRNALGRLHFQPHRFIQVTEPTNQFLSFPAFFPLAAIDKIYRRGNIRIHGARVARSALTRRASDHLPIVVDFSLGPSSPF